MKTTHSFSIDFVTRLCKENKKFALIYVRITVDGERPKEISIKEKIVAADWDNKQEIVKGKSLEAKTINATIDNVRFRIKERYREMVDNSALITAEGIKQAYLGVHANLKGHKLTDLLEYYYSIWKDKLAEGSLKNYRTTIDYIKLFIEKKYPVNNEVYLSQVNMQLMTDFESYVRNNPIKQHDPCKGNGVGKHVQRFKRIMNWATKIEWLKANPVEKYCCPLRKSKRKKLTIEELVALENKVFINEKLNYVRDLFLFSCYTGLAFVDVMALRQSHFEKTSEGIVWCKIYRTKSDELCAVPFLQSAINIFLARGVDISTPNSSPIFPAITNQEINRSLKIIAEICGIVTYLTFHVARHTFAKVVALKNGVPLETVQIMLGHTKITTTQIYADVDEEKVINDMAGLEEKLDRKRGIVLAARRLLNVAD